MTACEILNLRSAELVRVNNSCGIWQRQGSAVDANPSHAIKILAMFNHGKRLGVKDMHSTELVSGNGEEFAQPVAQEKIFRPANVRTFFFA